MIRQDEVISNHGNVYLPKQFLQESETAQKAVELFLANPAVVDIAQPLERVKHNLGLNLSKRQSEGVEMVFRHNLSIITGGPGTGKTTVLKTVIEVYRPRCRRDCPAHFLFATQGNIETGYQFLSERARYSQPLGLQVGKGHDGFQQAGRQHPLVGTHDPYDSHQSHVYR